MVATANERGSWWNTRSKKRYNGHVGQKVGELPFFPMLLVKASGLNTL
jgi:hypothetical protein